VGGVVELLQRADPYSIELPSHQLLGNPQPIQGDMMLSCQLTSHGLYTGDGEHRKDPRFETLKAGAADWRLLLQISSDDGAGMMWQDVGRLYYCIPEPALRARDFERVWLDMQCS
jgi:hypothetical protein